MLTKVVARRKRSRITSELTIAEFRAQHFSRIYITPLLRMIELQTDGKPLHHPYCRVLSERDYRTFLSNCASEADGVLDLFPTDSCIVVTLRDRRSHSDERDVSVFVRRSDTSLSVVGPNEWKNCRLVWTGPSLDGGTFDEHQRWVVERRLDKLASQTLSSITTTTAQLESSVSKWIDKRNAEYIINLFSAGTLYPPMISDLVRLIAAFLQTVVSF